MLALGPTGKEHVSLSWAFERWGSVVKARRGRRREVIEVVCEGFMLGRYYYIVEICVEEFDLDQKERLTEVKGLIVEKKCKCRSEGHEKRETSMTRIYSNVHSSPRRFDGKLLIWACNSR